MRLLASLLVVCIFLISLVEGEDCFDDDDAVESVTGSSCSELSASGYCESYLCPSCAYSGYCDLSCGYCTVSPTIASTSPSPTQRPMTIQPSPTPTTGKPTQVPTSSPSSFLCADSSLIKAVTGYTCHQFSEAGYCAEQLCPNCTYAGYCDATCGYCNTSTPSPTPPLSSPYDALPEEIMDICDDFIHVSNVSHLQSVIESEQNFSALLCVKVSKTLKLSEELQIGAANFRLILVGEGPDSLIHVRSGAQVYLENVWVTSGNATDTCIVVSAWSRLEMVDSTVSNCVNLRQSWGNSSGGALRVTQSQVILRNTTISKSFAKYGGAVAVSATSTLRFIHCSLIHNTATLGGGAVFSKRSTVFVHNTFFISNDVIEYSGGGVEATDYSRVILTGNSTFVHNTAYHLGGGISVVQSSLILKDFATFVGNVGNMGGAISLIENATLHAFDDTSFENNTAQFAGGCIAAFSTLTIANRTKFSGCKASYAGAILASPPLEATGLSIIVEGPVLFNNNSATLHGGAILLISGELAGVASVQGANFTSNIAGGIGGGLLLVQSATSIYLRNTTFQDNHARDYGGAIGGFGGASFNMSGCKFFFNSATAGDGGAIGLLGLYSQSFSIVDQSHFYGNIASSRGGAIYMQLGSLQIRESTFSTSRALSGGIISVSNTLLHIDSSMFRMSSAFANGGCIFAERSSNLTIQKSQMEQCEVDYQEELCVEIRLMSALGIAEGYFSAIYEASILDTADVQGWGGAYFILCTELCSDLETKTMSEWRNDSRVVTFGTTESSFDIHTSCLDVGKYYILITPIKVDLNALPDRLASEIRRYLQQFLLLTVYADSTSYLLVMNGNDDWGAFEVSTATVDPGGGCVAIADETILQLSDSNLKSCSSSVNGGAIMIQSTTLDAISRIEMTNSTIEGPFAESYGAFIYNFMSTALVSGTIFSGDSQSDSSSAVKLGGRMECTSLCPAGRYGSCTQVGDCFSCSGLCIDCPIGTYLNESGAVQESDCLPCTKGTASDETGVLECTSCPKGKYATQDGFQGYGVDSGAFYCASCPANQYAATSRSTGCDPCPDDVGSDVGAAECLLCLSGYYWNEQSGSSGCTKCPSDANCVGQDYMPTPKPGHWIDRQSAAYSSKIYSCPRRLSCKGVEINTQQPSLTDRCWEYESFANIENRTCSSSIQCRENAEGPFCGACAAGFYFSSSSGLCVHCDDHIAARLVPACIIIALMFVWFSQVVSTASSSATFSPSHGTIKVLFTTGQILSTISWNMGIQLPGVLNNIASGMESLQIELPWECLHRTADYPMRAYTTSLLPLCICGTIWLVYLYQYFSLSSRDQGKLRDKHTTASLFLLYLVFPTVAVTQFRGLDCVSLSETSGGHVLRVDTHVSCDSKDFKTFSIRLAALVACYQVFLIGLATFLYWKREQLNPPELRDVVLRMKARDRDVSLAPFRFFFKDYKCEAYMFEIFDMFRRILFICVTAFIRNSTQRILFGLFFSLFCVWVFHHVAPYRSWFNNVMAQVCHYFLAAIFFSLLLVEGGQLRDAGLTTAALGILLTLTLFTITLSAMLRGYYDDRRAAKARTALMIQPPTLEHAEGFSTTKFRTTLDRVKQDIPSSHDLVFFYTTTQATPEILMGGIPAFTQYSGLVFSREGPGDLQQRAREDPSLLSTLPFDGFDTCLGVSLPKFALESWEHPHPIDPLSRNFLVLVPAELLSALRPLFVEHVLSTDRWLDGFLLLSPACAVRAYSVQIGSTPISSVETSLLSMKLKKLGEDRSHSKETSSLNLYDRSLPDLTFGIYPVSTIEVLNSVEAYLDRMKYIRNQCTQSGLVPLFHFTAPFVGPLILEGGLRMSTQGQGDGGVYLSLNGPVSYGLGSRKYEINLVKDCFGEDRLQEYVGKGQLDLCVVYATEPRSIHPTPGGRRNAMMVLKSTFSSFSLPDTDGAFYLRPDRIVGCFLFKDLFFLRSNEVLEKYRHEKVCEIRVKECIRRAEPFHETDISRVSVSHFLATQMHLDESVNEFDDTCSEDEVVERSRKSTIRATLAQFMESRVWSPARSSMAENDHLELPSRTAE